MPKNPTVSVVIRTKDEALWIGKVLRFFKSQTFQDFEIIIVDSESNDNTVEIVQKFPVKLIRIKQKDFNYSYALNLGIKESKGKYICIISGHSIPISDTWLSDGLKNFNDNAVAGVSGFYSSFPVGYFSRELGRLFSTLHSKKYKGNSPWMTNTNSLIRRSLWEKYPFDERLPECEDYDWASEMISRGFRVVKDPKFNVFHSHFLLGRPGYLARKARWAKIVFEINKRKRPGKGFSRVLLALGI